MQISRSLHFFFVTKSVICKHICKFHIKKLIKSACFSLQPLLSKLFTIYKILIIKKGENNNVFYRIRKKDFSKNFVDSFNRLSACKSSCISL